MINEQLIVDSVLSGQKINVYQMRYITSLLARHFLSQGFDTIETRNMIFDWANKNGYYIKVFLKSVVNTAYKDAKPLRGETPVYVNSSDIAFIKKTAKTKLQRKVALAFLCYAKVYADTDGVVEMPISTVVDWIGQKDPHNTYTRVMPVLLANGFFTNEEDIVKWHGKITKRTRTMRICHTITNTGKHELVGNDFDALYNSIKWK